MSNGPGVSSNFAGRDVILMHHHGAFQKPRLNFFQRRTDDAKWGKFSRRAQRSLDQEEPALRPPAKTGTSAALHESAPSPTRYPACLAQPAARSRRRGQRVTQRALRGAGDERGGRCGRRKRRRRGESPRPHGSRSPTRACTRSPRLRTLGGLATCRASRTQPQPSRVALA